MSSFYDREDAEYDFYAKYDYLSEAYGAEARQLDEQNAREPLSQCTWCGGWLPEGKQQPETGPARETCSRDCARQHEAYEAEADEDTLTDLATDLTNRLLHDGEAGPDDALDLAGTPF